MDNSKITLETGMAIRLTKAKAEEINLHLKTYDSAKEDSNEDRSRHLDSVVEVFRGVAMRELNLSIKDYKPVKAVASTKAPSKVEPVKEKKVVKDKDNTED